VQLGRLSEDTLLDVRIDNDGRAAVLDGLAFAFRV
jgi:hypothetical protein